MTWCLMSGIFLVTSLHTSAGTTGMRSLSTYFLMALRMQSSCMKRTTMRMSSTFWGVR
jgi:hypothetical protein